MKSKEWFYVSFYPVPHFIISNFPCCPMDLFLVHKYFENLGLWDTWFIKASSIRVLILVRCLPGFISCYLWVQKLNFTFMGKCPQSESQIQNKVQLISLDSYGFWGTYFLVNTLMYLKIFFIILIIFSGRAGHGVKCVILLGNGFFRVFENTIFLK